jgi:hypothetical protein
MAKCLAAVALDVGGATNGSVGHHSLCCNTRRPLDLLLSCPFDVEGAVLCTTLVEGGVAARTLEEGATLAGAGSYRGVKVLFRRCYW